MGNFTKWLLGSAVAGATAATVYSCVKKYRAIIKDSENDGTKENGIDLDAAKKATKETFSALLKGSEKAFTVAKDSAKAVSDIVMENYGEEIQSAKDLASEKYEEVKGIALDKVGEFKEMAGEKYDEFKEKAGEKYDELKVKAGEKYDEFKEKAGEKYNEWAGKMNEEGSSMTNEEDDDFKQSL